MLYIASLNLPPAFPCYPRPCRSQRTGTATLSTLSPSPFLPTVSILLLAPKTRPTTHVPHSTSSGVHWLRSACGKQQEVSQPQGFQSVPCVRAQRGIRVRRGREDAALSPSPTLKAEQFFYICFNL